MTANFSPKSANFGLGRLCNSELISPDGEEEIIPPVNSFPQMAPYDGSPKIYIIKKLSFWRVKNDTLMHMYQVISNTTVFTGSSNSTKIFLLLNSYQDIFSKELSYIKLMILLLTHCFRYQATYPAKLAIKHSFKSKYYDAAVFW